MKSWFIVIVAISLFSYLVFDKITINKRLGKLEAEIQNQSLNREAPAKLNLPNPDSVVNIFCDTQKGGSGTIISKEGLILTNNHVVSKAKNCSVTLPDNDSGSPISDYDSTPIVIPNLSKKYDIALLQINGLHKEKDGTTAGSFPTDFPSYIKQDICDKVSLKLADSVRVYGYPEKSGGINLTVTEGIINSIDYDAGEILTSAKITAGNSGGLALDENGCFVGVPSGGIIDGQYKDFGVIISRRAISDFLDELPDTEYRYEPLRLILPTF